MEDKKSQAMASEEAELKKKEALLQQMHHEVVFGNLDIFHMYHEVVWDPKIFSKNVTLESA